MLVLLCLFALSHSVSSSRLFLAHQMHFHSHISPSHDFKRISSDPWITFFLHSLIPHVSHFLIMSQWQRDSKCGGKKINTESIIESLTMRWLGQVEGSLNKPLSFTHSFFFRTLSDWTSMEQIGFHVRALILRARCPQMSRFSPLDLNKLKSIKFNLFSGSL